MPTWAEGRLDLGVAEPGQLSRVERPTGIAARLFSTSPPCFFTCSATIASTAARSVGVEVASSTRCSASGRPLSTGPGTKGGDELVLVDQAVLEREQSEQEVARWISRSGHDRELPIETSRADNTSEVHPHPRKANEWSDVPVIITLDLRLAFTAASASEAKIASTRRDVLLESSP